MATAVSKIAIEVLKVRSVPGKVHEVSPIDILDSGSVYTHADKEVLPAESPPKPDKATKKGTAPEDEMARRMFDGFAALSKPGPSTGAFSERVVPAATSNVPSRAVR